MIVIIFVAGTFAANDVAIHEGENDPSKVVVDEVVGQWITLFLLPFSWKVVVLAFILFRIMDILKPFPIRRLEGIKNGLGIMLDDVLAGIYANILIQILLLIPPIYKIII